MTVAWKFPTLSAAFQDAKMLQGEVVIDVAVHNKQWKLTHVSHTVRRRPRRCSATASTSTAHRAFSAVSAPAGSRPIGGPTASLGPLKPKSRSAHAYDRVGTVAGV